MKKKDLEKLKIKTSPELEKDRAEKKDKLWNLTRDIHAGKVKNVRGARELRKDIARISTILRDKKETK